MTTPEITRESSAYGHQARQPHRPVHSSTERIRRRDLDDWIAGLSERPR